MKVMLDLDTGLHGVLKEAACREGMTLRGFLLENLAKVGAFKAKQHAIPGAAERRQGETAKTVPG